MTLQANGSDRTFIAAADLRTKQFYAVKVDSAGKAALCSAAGEFMIGVLQNKPNAGEAATVRTFGRTKWIASGTLAAGALLATDASGKAKAANLGTVDTSNTGAAADAVRGSYVAGIHVGDAASANGDLLEAELLHIGTSPTTAT